MHLIKIQFKLILVTHSLRWHPLLHAKLMRLYNPLVMLQSQFIAQELPFFLYHVLLRVIHDLLLEDAFEKRVARALVHVQNVGCHNTLDLMLVHVVQQLPVIVVHNALVFECLCGVLLYVSPFSSVSDLIIQDWIFLLDLHSVLSLDSLNLLATLVLVHDTLGHAGDEPILTLRLVLNQLFKLLVKLILSLNLIDLWQVPHIFFKSSVWINIVSRESGDHWLQELRFVPEVVPQMIILMVLLPDAFHLLLPVRLALPIE